MHGADSNPLIVTIPPAARKHQFLWKENTWWYILSNNKQRLFSHQENPSNRSFLESHVPNNPVENRKSPRKEGKSEGQQSFPGLTEPLQSSGEEAPGGQADVYPMSMQEGLTLRSF